MDIKKNISIGSLLNNPLLTVNSNDAIIQMSGNVVIYNHEHKKNTFTVDNINNRVITYGQSYNELQIIQIKESKTLLISNNIILLDNTFTNINTDMILVPDNLINGFIVKIIMYKNPKSIQISINGNKIINVGNMLEFLYINDVFMKLNKL